jgi:hypothetical protein
MRVNVKFDFNAHSSGGFIIIYYSVLIKTAKNKKTHLPKLRNPHFLYTYFYQIYHLSVKENLSKPWQPIVWHACSRAHRVISGKKNRFLYTKTTIVIVILVMNDHS